MELTFVTAPNRWPDKSPLREVPAEMRSIVCGRPLYFRRSFQVVHGEKASEHVSVTAAVTAAEYVPAGEAILHVTALGFSEVYLDGEKIGQDFFAPGWTDYNTRVYYDTYHLSLTEGEHVISAVVADGWYAGNMGSYGPGQYDDIVAFAARIVFADGTKLDTDDTWKVSNGGYIYADLFCGEYFDERLEQVDWKKPGFDDSHWEAVRPAFGYVNGTQFLLRKLPGIREMHTLTAVKESRDADGNYIYDMGQNMTGVVRVRFQGKAGEALRLRFGEMTEGDRLYTANLRTAYQTDTFIPSSDGEHGYMPRLTYHGFRYVGSNQPLTLLEGVVLYTECRETGRVETSSPLVNQLFSNQVWGQRCNFLDVPTDCPQRNERLGWIGDAQIFARTAMYNMRADLFYEKYLTDIRDAMMPDGSMSEVAPRVYVTRGRTMFDRPHPGWGDAMFIIPYHHWKIYGDKQILQDNYEAMQRYFRFLEGRAEQHLQPKFGRGDWLNPDCVTDVALLASAYFAYDAMLLTEMAAALGKKEDAEYYRSSYDAIRLAFLKHFTEKDGRLTGDTQCAYALALVAGLYKDKAETAAHLARTVAEKEYHLATGFLGTAYLLPMLCEGGYTDLAYTILLQDTYPSWGYCIKMGATTMWEHWDSYTEEKGFANPSMNSFNHYSFGSVGQWMYEYMGGIQPLTPGFARFAVVPHMDPRVPQVKVSYESVRGEICVEYDTRTGILTVTVPEKTVAEVTLEGRQTALPGGRHTLAFTPLK